MSLIELAERVEKASGPDRELGAAIRKATHGDFGYCGDEGWSCGACSVPAHELTQEPGCGAPLGLHDERRSYPSDWRDDERLPAYTASLDAAMTLVPEGVMAAAVRFSDGRGRANIHDGTDLGGSGIDTRAATPALALCAASLKARALLEVNGG